MKKIAVLFLVFLMAVTLAACSHGEVNTASPTAEAIPSSKILIAYFAMPETDGVDAVSGASRVIVDGQLLASTQHIAQLIAKETGGELFRIETVEAYPGVHAPLLDYAQREQVHNARPELKSAIDNLGAYDVVFVGFPNWWADMPMPLYTFFEAYDFSGKTIIPFSTHGGSGFSRTISTIAELEPGATVVTNGLTISRNSVATAESAVLAWLGQVLNP